MATANTYLNFPGNTLEAFTFYRTVFGGEFSALQRFKDASEGAKLSDEDQEKIMHIALPIGSGSVLMATDALDSRGHQLLMGNNFYICVSTDSEGEANAMFGKLAAGGAVELQIQKTFWGSYFGMLKDKFGIQWMIEYTSRQN